MKYKLFSTPACPNCHAIREFFKTAKIEGEDINAASKEGLEQARKYEVSAVPTVLFLEDGEVKSKATSLEEVKRVLENKSLV